MKKICRILFLALLCFASLSADAGEVVIVAASPGYYTSLSRHIARWLKGQSVPSVLSSPSTMKADLSDAKIAFLVGFANPGEREMASFRSFRKRGGKLVVFHTAAPELAALMGVKVLGYKAESYPGQWSRMNFAVNFPEGLPTSIRQSSTVLQRALPIAGKGRVLATWSDRSGKSTGDAAWIGTSAGFWMTHVLLADGDEEEKAQLVAAFVGSIAPNLWNYKSFLQRRNAEKARIRQIALAQVPRKGEIHAVWDHSGCGIYPGDWPRTIKLLQEARVTDLFVNVAGAGFAHYNSSVLPRSRRFEQEGDQLKACLNAAKGSGIRIHPWILCFNATRATPAVLAAYKKRGWCLTNEKGESTEYLDPSNPQVRNLILTAIDELQTKYRVNGIHLDFVRWYERSNRPRNAADVISRFVADARRRIMRPNWFTVAVLGKYPSCVAAVGQDWYGWLDSNLVDYVVPMDYTEDLSQFESYLKQHAATRSNALRTIAGIGVTANESRLDAAQVIKQISLARKYRLAGVALFDLDVVLEKNILPYLQLGIW